MLDVDAEVASLSAEIKRLGQPGPEGKTSVKYGVLFRETGDVFEALMGTLRAAKKRGVVTFEGQLLLQGVHDDVDVVLMPEAAAAAAVADADGDKEPAPAPAAIVP